jgi:poly(3-hydroxybutyrate) depolymerase
MMKPTGAPYVSTLLKLRIASSFLPILLAMVMLASFSARSAPAEDFHQFTHDGHTLDYVLLLPQNFDKSKPYPVLLALPPGDQSRQLVEAALQLYWEDEASKRGWVVVSPAAPDGASFDGGLASELPPLLDEIAKTVTFEGGKTHLAGVSNGGRSAYRLATAYPDRFLSLTVLPGIPPDDETTAALARLKGIPVAAFAGADDAEWSAGSRETKAKLDRLGIENTLEIVAGESHVIRLDPAVIFDLLDTRRPKAAAAGGNAQPPSDQPQSHP